MGRKIPVRKHRGVKDPMLQMARRDACVSINAAPSNPADQELPKSVLEIQRLCSLVKNNNKDGRKKKKTPNDNLIDTRNLFDKEPKCPGMKKTDKGFPRILQNPGECDDAFVLRFSAAAHEYINEVQLGHKHGVGLEKSNETIFDDLAAVEKNNKSKTKKRKHSEAVEDTADHIIFTSKRGKSFKTSHYENMSKEKGTKPNKRQRQKLRRALLKKEEHHDNELDSSEEIDFKCLKDDVKFGEVAHRPPQFTAKPRGSSLNSKPGTKDLLLKQMMKNKKKESKKNKSDTNKLSNAQKHFLEKERLRVVQAYRDLKASKLKSQ